MDYYLVSDGGVFRGETYTIRREESISEVGPENGHPVGRHRI
jgi:hypothetical protein